MKAGTMGAKILVIDDEEYILDILQQFLGEECGYSVSTSTGAMDGLTRLMQDNYKLVIADVNMPGMDGMEMVMRIKASYPDMRVLMISGRGDASNIVKAIKIGADDFITKPFELEAIRERVAALATNDATHETSKRVEKQPIHAFGDYEIIKQIGSGGMGIVYRANQKSTGDIVALKILFPKLIKDKVALQRFLREARLIGEMNHPNLVRGLDVGEVDETYYLAMELINGNSLDDVIVDTGPFALDYAVMQIEQMFDALNYMHNRNVIHRDIKPTNIIITSDDSLKLVDMGLTKYVNQNQTVTEPGFAAGTAGFMPPEAIFENDPLDIRADIYSTGATLYYMLTGELPFEGDSMHIFDLQKRYVPSVRELNVEVSPELDAFIGKMMAIKRHDRFDNPQQMIDAFNKLDLPRKEKTVS